MSFAITEVYNIRAGPFFALIANDSAIVVPRRLARACPTHGIPRKAFFFLAKARPIPLN